MKRFTVCIVVLFVVGISLSGCDDNLLDPGANGRLVVSVSGTSDGFGKVAGELSGIEAVLLNITGADIKPEDAMWRSLAVLVDMVDLVELADNGLAETLIDEELEAGWYEQIRLYFDDSQIVVNGDTLDLFVPSGLQTGYKLVDAFEIESDVTYKLRINFDIEESVVMTGEGTYILQPTTRVTVETE
jgi:hypothetical protein